MKGRETNDMIVEDSSIEKDLRLVGRELSETREGITDRMMREFKLRGGVEGRDRGD